MTLEFIIALCALGALALGAGASAVIKGACSANAKKAAKAAENEAESPAEEVAADKEETATEPETAEPVAEETEKTEEASADVETPVSEEPVEQVIIAESSESNSEEKAESPAEEVADKEETVAEPETAEPAEEYLSVIKLSATPLNYLKEDTAAFGETDVDKRILKKGVINGEPIVIIGGDDALVIKEEEPSVEPVGTAEEITVNTEISETATETETVAASEEGSIFAGVNFGVRIPFKDKMLSAEENVKGYYDELNNEFLSYRKVHGRVSIAGASYRFGRDLIAKITYRGKTMKLHLALKVKDYDENTYHQKDMGEVKAYSEVPFTVKVKSDRGVKRAVALIAALAEKNGIEKKSRYEIVDSIKELKEI